MISVIENSRHWRRPKSLERFTSLREDHSWQQQGRKLAIVPKIFLCHRRKGCNHRQVLTSVMTFSITSPFNCNPNDIKLGPSLQMQILW